MYCSDCGFQVAGKPNFCPQCGHEVGKEKPQDITGKKVAVGYGPLGLNVLIVLIPTFIAVFVINQLFYGACFKAYCLAAAFPKVAIISAAVTWAIYAISNQDRYKE